MWTNHVVWSTRSKYGRNVASVILGTAVYGDPVRDCAGLTQCNFAPQTFNQHVVRLPWKISRTAPLVSQAWCHCDLYFRGAIIGPSETLGEAGCFMRFHAYDVLIHDSHSLQSSVPLVT